MLAAVESRVVLDCLDRRSFSCTANMPIAERNRRHNTERVVGGTACWETLAGLCPGLRGRDYNWEGTAQSQEQRVQPFRCERLTSKGLTSCAFTLLHEI